MSRVVFYHKLGFLIHCLCVNVVYTYETEEKLHESIVFFHKVRFFIHHLHLIVVCLHLEQRKIYMKHVVKSLN